METANQQGDNNRGARTDFGTEVQETEAVKTETQKTEVHTDSAGQKMDKELAYGQGAAVNAGYTEEDVKKLLQSEGDRRANQAIDSFKKAELARLRELAELQAEEKSQSERAAFMDNYNERLSELNKRELRITAQSFLSERRLPASLIDVIHLTDETELKAGVDALEKAFRLAVSQGVNERLRGALPETAAVSRMSDRINRIIGIQ